MKEAVTAPHGLVLPAIRARMGDWTYYVSWLKLGDVATQVSAAQEIHSSSALQDLLQRELTARSRTIRDYLLNQPQRFFNALILGTYGGRPEWAELEVREGPGGVEPPESLTGYLGFLTFDATVKLFAIDGQHRVVGIRQAVKVDSTLADEEVCVLLVPGVSANRRADDKRGFERTRRLFSTVNRYAKAVSKMNIIALDEDDVLAITTRRLVEENPLFQNEKVGLHKGKNISRSDVTSFTNIITVYDVMDSVLKPPGGWGHLKKLRGSDDELETYFRRATELWDLIAKSFPPVKEFARSAPSDLVAARYRNTQGGHLLFRPIGLMILAKALKMLLADGKSLSSAMRGLKKAPMELAGMPWRDLLWDAGNERILYASENQKVATKVLYHLAGGRLTTQKTSRTKLLAEWAGVLGVEPSQVKMPKIARG
ncbi:MAG: DNA sulfur modification protein DndB [Dehalococcoidia bacterium]